MATSTKHPRRLLDAYRFPGFRPQATIKGVFGDPKARVISLVRQKKTVCGCCRRTQLVWYDRKVRHVRDLSCSDTRVWLAVEVRRLNCRACSKVKTERLDFLADHPFHTKRFAWRVGRGTTLPTIVGA